MALKNGKPNPLNVLDLRQVSFPAHHFYFTSLPVYYPKLLLSINDWIYLNLNGRYYIGQDISLVNNHFTFTTKIGFEQEKELSFFKLACPHFH